jgi:hypothetical protein
MLNVRGGFVALALGLTLSLPAVYAAAGLSQEDAAGLVRQLGNESFRVRQQAERALLAMGVPAKDALLAGLDSPDAEIRARCQRVLLVVLDLDFRQRVNEFAGHEHNPSAHLPGWERYRRLAGETAGARDLFVEMQRFEGPILETIAAQPRNGAEILEIRCQDVQTSQYSATGERENIPLGTLAALFFAASENELPLSERTSSYLSGLSQQPALVEAIASGPRKEPLRRILGAWVARSTTANSAYAGLSMALRHDLPEGLEPALSILRFGGGQPQIVHFALLVVGKFGDKRHIADIEPVLANEVLLFSHNVDGKQMKVEVRDIALAVLVHLSGQSLHDYGMHGVQSNPQYLFNYSTLGFAEDTQRAEALKKWKAYAAQSK